jgi:ElaB/YqjD/DUF883 family membrane-anchored ribosome-binding protein
MVAMQPSRETTMPANTGPSTNLQGRISPNPGEGTAEGVVGQATEAVRNVAESASELAQDAYETGARYVREGRDRYPEASRYISEGSRIVSRPIEHNPLVAILIAGAVGYLVGYMIHGSGWQWNRESVPDYARRRAYSDRSAWE